MIEDIKIVDDMAYSELEELKQYIEYFNTLVKNADFADIRLGRSYSQLLIKEDNKIRTNHMTESSGFGIRMLKNGIWYFSSSTLITNESIKKAVSSLENKFKCEKTDLEPEINKIDLEPFWKTDARFVPFKDKIEIVNELSESAKLKGISSRIAYYQDGVNLWVIGNNRGALVSFYDSYPRLMLESFVKSGNSKQSVRKSIESNGGFELFDSKKVKELGKKTSEEALKLVDAKAVKGGKYDVVLDHSMTGVYSHEAFGHATEADAVLNKESILEDKLNRRVGPDIVNITDDPTINGLRGSYYFDQEGTKSRKRYLVKDGILMDYLNSLETAKKLKLKPNGAARSMSFNVIPIPRMSNTFIEPGDFSEDIFEDIKEGIAFYGFQYGYTDPGSGKFMFKAQYGREIKNGKLKEYVRDAALAGSTLDILNKIDAIGKDIEFDGGSCGKMGQWVPVTSGGPSIRVRGVVVGGQ